MTMVPLDKIRRISFPRKAKLILGLVAVAVAVIFLGGNQFVAVRLEKALTSRVSRGGMSLEWESSSWDPWRGLHLVGLRLHRQDNERALIAELENLSLSIPLNQIFAGDERETRWAIHNSDITLHDTAGAVKLKRISLNLRARNDEIELIDFKSGDKGLTTEFTGRILLGSFTGRSSGPVELELGAVRATLATLDVSPERAAFHVTGSFTIDLKKDEPDWRAELKGKGGGIEWKGVRWESATAQATLSSKVSQIHYDLQTANGSTRGDVSKTGWSESPFTFKGEISDSNGRKDEYHGNYRNRRMTVESLKGAADLQLLSRDVPGLASRFPSQLKFQTFPMVDLRNLVLDSSSEGPRWSFESLEVKAKDGVTVVSEKQEIHLRGLSFNAGFDGADLTVRDSVATVFGGTIAVAGRYRDGILRRSTIGVEDIRLCEIKHLIGEKRQDTGPGVISLEYQGEVDFKKNRADGAGSMRLENAPVFDVPLLDQVYDIFMALIPGVDRASEGTFDAKFKITGDHVDVTKFEAKGGSLTVSAIGKVDLEKRRVSGRARGKLVGLPGLVTSPLSRLLEMEVAGPYEDIRVKPLGPTKLASNSASGTVGVVVDTIEETGKIAGTVLTEGVKLPFRLFQKEKQEKAGKKSD